MNGIAWSIVQKMMIDAPAYDYDNTENINPNDIVLTDDNADELLNYINSL